MSTIFALAGLTASDYRYARNADQRVLYNAVQEYVNRINDEAARARAVFVGETTSLVSERYQLPGSGFMQQRADGTYGTNVAASGSWDVAYPLYDYSEQIAMTQVEMAYMTPAELDRHIQTVVTRYINRDRIEILKALLLSSNATFVDPRHGSLTVRRLANADSTLYPPRLGASTDLASHSHYFGTNYATSSISNTNDPVVTMVEHLAEHFGDSNGQNVIVFAGTAVTDKLRGLSAFVDVPDTYIRPGQDTAVPVPGLPTVPGLVIGRHNSGAWISQWREIPADYLLAIHTDADAPLKRRVDPAETGLPGTLAPVFEVENKPIESMSWQARFGYGVANRLSAVAAQCVASTSYTAPTFAA